MEDIRTYFEKKKGWWIEERAIFPCILPKDGLVVVFKRSDIESIMDSNYPNRGQGFGKYWFFNETRDREIAEVDAEDRIVCNPRVLWDHFLR